MNTFIISRTYDFSEAQRETSRDYQSVLIIIYLEELFVNL